MYKLKGNLKHQFSLFQTVLDFCLPDRHSLLRGTADDQSDEVLQVRNDNRRSGHLRRICSVSRGYSVQQKQLQVDLVLFVVVHLKR